MKNNRHKKSNIKLLNHHTVIIVVIFSLVLAAGFYARPLFRLGVDPAEAQFRAQTVLYMDFEGNSTNRFYDKTPGSIKNPPSPTGGMTTSTVSRVGDNSGRFSANNYVAFTDSPDWVLGQDFTIDFWFRFFARPAANSYTGFFEQYQNNTANYGLFFRKSSSGADDIGWFGFNLPGCNTGLSDVAVVDLNWHHFAMTRTGANSWRFYIDGSLYGSGSCNLTVPDLATPPVNNFFVGRHHYPSGASGAIRYFNGYIDNFRVTKGSLLWTSSPFCPPAEPCATTSAATLISMSSMRLNGVASSVVDVSPTTRGFDWKQGDCSGVFIDSYIDSIFSDGAYSYVLSGLPQNTPYCFRAKAQNSAGWSYGASTSAATLPISFGNIRGFAWSSNFGWISMNTVDCDLNGNGLYDDGGAPADCPPPGTPYFYYGVNYDTGSDDLSGYAWSPNLGWVYFGPDADLGAPYGLVRVSDAPVTVSNSSPKIWAHFDDLSDRIIGWAKILSQSATDGWISLSDDNTGDAVNYGVTVDINDVHGYAFGQGVGWISFNCEEGAADGTTVCAADGGTSDYKVAGNFNTPPSAINLVAPDVTEEMRCLPSGVRQAWLKWTFLDADAGDTQGAYQVIFDDDNDPADPIIDTGQCTGVGVPTAACLIAADASSYRIPAANLAYSQQYWWWVKVWDDRGADSGLVQFNDAGDSDGDGNPLTFTTPIHEYPDPYFTREPFNPSAGEEVMYIDQSQYYPGPAVCDDANCAYLWEFSSGPGSDDTNATTTVFMPEIGEISATSTITEIDTGYACSTSTRITPKFKLPSWIETR